MTDNLLKAVKIAVVILIAIALGMGGWFLYKRYIAKDGEVQEKSDVVEITWWTLWEDVEDLQVLADAYTVQNPNVRINIEPQEVESQYRDKVLERINDGSLDDDPDIFRIHNTWLPLFEDYLTPVPSNVMTEDEYATTFYDTAVSDFEGLRGLYAIPLMYDGLGVYYNKDLLEDAGYAVPAETWDDFLTQARTLTQYDEDGNIEIAGAGIGTAENIDFSFDIASLLMLQEGASIVDSTGKTTFSTDTEKRAAKALKYYTDFATRYEVWDRTLPRDITMFTEGRLAMMFAPSWRVFDINNALEGAGATLDYDIAPVPQQPTVEETEVNWSTYWAEAVPSESENQEIAWDFLKFVTEQEQLQLFYEKCNESREFGEIYPRQDMADDLLSEKYVGAYIKMAQTSRSWRMADVDVVSKEFKDLIEDIVIAGGMSVDGIYSRLAVTAETIDQL
jgi:multiple sugar transport system substrate-binding protein